MISKWKTTKLGVLLIGYFVLALGIALFSYGFLYTTAVAFSYRLLERFPTLGTGAPNGSEEFYWIIAPCFIGASVIFIAVLLFLLQQKFSYILSISSIVERLEGGDLSARAEVLGDDELTDLAESINAMARALEDHIATEERLSKEKGEMVASLSHDIRTPLTSIISYIDLIKDGKGDSVEKRQHYLDIIGAKAYQIKGITDTLFEQSAGKETAVQRERVNGGLLIRQLLEDKGEELEEAGFQLIVDDQRLEAFEIEVEIMDLMRIFDNLCSNIIKYGEQSEVVKFIVGIESRSLQIIQSNRIRQEKWVGESNGIGLKSCALLVESYGGNMKVERTSKEFHIHIVIPL